MVKNYLIFLLISHLLISGCEKAFLQEEDFTFAREVEILDGSNGLVIDLPVDVESSEIDNRTCCNARSDQSSSQARTDLSGYLRIVVRDVKYPTDLAYLRFSFHLLNPSTGLYEKIGVVRARNQFQTNECYTYSTGLGVVSWGVGDPVISGSYQVEVDVATGRWIQRKSNGYSSGSSSYEEEICSSSASINVTL